MECNKISDDTSETGRIRTQNLSQSIFNSPSRKLLVDEGSFVVRPSVVRTQFQKISLKSLVQL